MAAESSNQQYDPDLSKFFGAVPAGTGAPGSQGAAGAATPPDNALSSQVTSVYESVQNVPVPRVGAGLDDTAVPGQLNEGISGLTAAQTASTGAGQGSPEMTHPNAATPPRAMLSRGQWNEV